MSAVAPTMTHPLSCTRIAAWTLAAVVLQILGLSLFVVGFFPVKPTLPGFSGPESYRMPTCDPTTDKEELDLSPDHLRSLYREMSKITPAFDRLILMVVDGLPAEFVLGRGDKRPTKKMEAMPYTQSLLSSRRATAYHAKAAPPTVTLPRLKAMVSGAIGGFLDVAFNFNTQALLDDNLLDQFKRIGWKLVMLGDETWIKLFPGLFIRQDGVSSFYVKDTVEVDFNVSRHLEFELASKDWNLLILHYLGLDHAGHIGGRHSNLMALKLKEMDEVIKTIHDNLDEHTLLVVVSDHGMTDGGNHGGSSYQETDSLILFIGLRTELPDYVLNARKGAFQVDIAPTLALLFGVPIPKNNVGVLLAESFVSLTDEQILRALELNSWQLLRLLQAHLPGLLCGTLSCSFGNEHSFRANASLVITKERLHCLFSRAMAAHKMWVHHHDSSFISNNTDDLVVAVGSYYEFLRNASEWLSRRATDKPDDLLFGGIFIMLISCVLLLILLFYLLKEVYFLQKQPSSPMEKGNPIWHLDEVFVFIGILIHVLSLGASSMVEEEQYTWHFLVSTLSLIFLYTSIESILRGKISHSTKLMEGAEKFTLKQSWKFNSNDASFTNIRLPQLKTIPDYYQLSSVLVILICGRVLRGWYQGGVNWVHLPDVFKWLEQAGTLSIGVLRIISLILVMVLSSFTFTLVRSRRSIVHLVLVGHFLSGILVLLHIIKTHSHDSVPIDYSSTLLAQFFYMTAGMTVIITVIASPWVLPVHYCETHSMTASSLNSCFINKQTDSLVVDIQDSIYLIGWAYTASWCLLQLLLQQPVNALPIILLFVQLLATIFYFSCSESHHKQWVEVSAIQFLGMAGHFGLGNSNSLATIDVAGAFIGISNHSTVLSGILMFICTYASPLLSFLSMVVYISMKEMRPIFDQKNSVFSCMLKTIILYPCVLPLVLNSVVLTAFTIVLLLMRNHLFVWSVFSPKYLYICAATLSVYIGVCIIAATGFYVCTVIVYRKKMVEVKIPKESEGIRCQH